MSSSSPLTKTNQNTSSSRNPICRKGFDGTSIRRISKEAKINIAMVSYYFGLRNDYSLYRFWTKDLKFQIENLSVEKSWTYREKTSWIEIYINRINCNKGIYRIFFEFSDEKEILIFKLNDLRTGNLKAFKL
jgi:hypothetical protein